MKESDDVVQLGGGTTDLLQQLEQTLPAHKVKCLGEVNEGDVERHLLLTHFSLSCRMENIMSTVDLLLLKPHWDSG